MAIADSTPGAKSSPLITPHKSTTAWALREAAALTTEYVASGHMLCGTRTSVGVYIDYASVDYTSIQVCVDGSPTGDDGTWRAIRPSRGAVTVTPLSTTLANQPSATSDGYVLDVPVEAGVHALRVRIKRTGGSATGTVTVTAY